MRTDKENDVEGRQSIHRVLGGPGVLYKEVLWPDGGILKLIKQLVVRIQVALWYWQHLQGSTEHFFRAFYAVLSLE